MSVVSVNSNYHPQDYDESLAKTRDGPLRVLSEPTPDLTPVYHQPLRAPASHDPQKSLQRLKNNHQRTAEEETIL